MAVTNAYLNSIRQTMIDKVDHAQFKIGNSYTRAEIKEKRINSNGTVTIGFNITVSASATITQCRLRDANGNVLATKAENISMSATANAVYYFFTFNVYELVT